VSFRDREFFINIDELQEPKLGTFLEIKSRTWSRHDAQEKAGLILELLELLDMKDTVAVAEEYPDLHV
jgi:5-methylthioadenosine/S-adenosylhomocysteine deaminase